MALRKLRVPALSAILFGCISLSMGQLVVNATAPYSELRRQPSSGSASSIGRSLPVQVEVEINPERQNGAGMMEVDFVLRNNGEKPILLPVSPNPSELEPSDPDLVYTMQVLTLRLSSSTDLRAELKGGATLFGNANYPGTMLTLAPGQFLRVRSLVAVPSRSTKGSAANFTASVDLEKETIRTTNGKTVSESQDLGRAKSSPSRYPMSCRDMGR